MAPKILKSDGRISAELCEDVYHLSIQYLLVLNNTSGTKNVQQFPSRYKFLEQGCIVKKILAENILGESSIEIRYLPAALSRSDSEIPYYSNNIWMILLKFAHS